MARDIVDADVEHYHAAIKILIENYPIKFVRRTLMTTLDGLEEWYEEFAPTQEGEEK